MKLAEFQRPERGSVGASPFRCITFLAESRVLVKCHFVSVVFVMDLGTLCMVVSFHAGGSVATASVREHEWNPGMRRWRATESTTLRD